MLSEKDSQQITEHGLTLDTVQTQIDYFKKGFPPTKLSAPATVGDGILKLDESKLSFYRDKYNGDKPESTIVKFVPASGAASRMFKSLFSFLEEYTGSDEDYNKLIENTGKGTVFEFLKNLEQFACYDDLSATFSEKGQSLSESHLKREYSKIVAALLNSDGLNYGQLPKGLLKFHKEGDKIKTPVEEHIIEGCQYAMNSDQSVKIHFTVSPEHMDPFKSHVAAVKSDYESKYDCKLDISYSVQNPGTDTIAVDLDNEPFRNSDGSILFRPAGHGALLENLDSIDSDIVFLKNIDNVVPDRLKPDTIAYKEALGGVLLELQEKVFDILKTPEKVTVEEIAAFAQQSLGYKPHKPLTKEEWLEKLNRPIRVCGMVQNQGDPGGGPFWVTDENGGSSLQIVETAQIDLEDKSQKELLNQSTHFNPVDVVCSVKDFQGNKFDLLKYRDPDAGFATEKSKDGKTLKAQELPGLWNGSMAFWNTIFVEVPIITFNPVKTINDLLKSEHRGEN